MERLRRMLVLGVAHEAPHEKGPYAAWLRGVLFVVPAGDEVREQRSLACLSLHGDCNSVGVESASDKISDHLGNWRRIGQWLCCKEGGITRRRRVRRRRWR